MGQEIITQPHQFNSSVTINADLTAADIHSTQSQFDLFNLSKNRFSIDNGKWFFTNNSGTQVASIDTSGNLSISNILSSYNDVKTSGDFISQTGKFTNYEENDYILIDPSNDSISFVSNAIEAARIISSGNVGFGTTTPNERLTVVGDISATGDVSVNTGSRLNLATGSTGMSIFRDAGANGMAFSSDNSTRMFIADGGNVGIGTTAPSTKLHLSGGSFRIQGNAQSFEMVGTDHVYTAYYPDGFSAGRKAWHGFGSSSINRFDIVNEFTDGSGHITMLPGTNANVGINTSFPNVKLTVNGDVSSNGTFSSKLGVFNNQSGNEGGQITLMDNSGSGGWEIDNNQRQLRFFRDKGVQNITGFALLTSGDLFLKNNEIVITSDSGNGIIKVGTSGEPYNYGSGTTVFGTTNGLGSSSSAPNNTNNTVFGFANGNTNSTLNNSSNNAIFGSGNGVYLTTGGGNSFIGTYAGQLITSGNTNVCVGYAVGGAVSTGSNNVAIGSYAGSSFECSNSICIGTDIGANISNNTSIAIGSQNFYSGSTANTGGNNLAIGHAALNMIEGTASSNIAVGNSGLQSNTTGSYNICLGAAALQDNTTGIGNIGIGFQANIANTTGHYNIAIGYQALDANTLGNYNIAIGRAALGTYNNSFGTAGNNTAIGYNSLVATVPTSNTNGLNNTALGYSSGDSNTIGSNNTFIGYDAGGSVALSGNNNTCIGNGSSPSGPGAANEITLGNASITSLRCADQTIAALSDARDKTKIENLQLGLEFINSLRPVKFEWKTREGSAKDGTEEAGFIAQELLEVEEKTNCKDYLKLVYEANPDRLEAAYARLIPVLVKSVQDLSEQNTKLKEEIEILKSKIN